MVASGTGSRMANSRNVKAPSPSMRVLSPLMQSTPRVLGSPPFAACRNFKATFRIVFVGERSSGLVLLAKCLLMSDSPETEFTTVAKVGDIPEGEGVAYPVKGRMVAVFNNGGTYQAID